VLGNGALSTASGPSDDPKMLVTVHGSGGGQGAAAILHDTQTWRLRSGQVGTGHCLGLRLVRKHANGDVGLERPKQGYDGRIWASNSIKGQDQEGQGVFVYIRLYRRA
jgi:hypothetical protein